MARRIALLTLVFALAGAGALLAATVTTVDEKTITGTISGLGPGKLDLATEKGPVSLAAEDVVSVVLKPAGKPAAGLHAMVLRNGDTIYGTIAGEDKPAADKPAGDRLQVKSASLGSVIAPISDIDCLLFDSADKPQAEAAPGVAAPDRTKDELLLRNGDTLAGVLARFGKDTLTFDCSLGKVDIPFGRIRSVRFAAVGQKYKEPGGLLISAACTDGSTITGTAAQLQGQELSITSTLGTALKFPIGNVSSLEFKNGRLVYLSDLEPTEAKETPLFDERPWHWRRDRSVAGNPIRMGGKLFRKGIGVHSRCDLTYDLAGKFKRFLSDVGIDDEVASGNVEIRIYVDGSQVFPKAQTKLLVSRRSGPARVDIDVSGGKKLTLVVDFGEELHVNDHVDWANARLTR